MLLCQDLVRTLRRKPAHETPMALRGGAVIRQAVYYALNCDFNVPDKSLTRPRITLEGDSLGSAVINQEEE